MLEIIKLTEWDYKIGARMRSLGRLTDSVKVGEDRRIIKDMLRFGK